MYRNCEGCGKLLGGPLCLSHRGQHCNSQYGGCAQCKRERPKEPCATCRACVTVFQSVAHEATCPRTCKTCFACIEIACDVAHKEQCKGRCRTCGEYYDPDDMLGFHAAHVCPVAPGTHVFFGGIPPPRALPAVNKGHCIEYGAFPMKLGPTQQAFYDLIYPFLCVRQDHGCGNAKANTRQYNFLFLFVDLGFGSCAACATYLPDEQTVRAARDAALADIDIWHPDLKKQVGQIALAYFQ